MAYLTYAEYQQTGGARSEAEFAALEMRAREAMRESRLRMRGNKMSLFLVYLSYLGWQILGIAVAFVLSEALASWFVSPLAQPALQWLLTLLAASFLRSYISAGEFAFFRALEQSEDGGE